MSLEKLRTGIGFDVHGFIAGRPLILGGVEVPHTKGLDGHSDADALTHAIVDALLGALGMGDIGQHFPSEDPKWKGAKSLKFLEWTRIQMEERKAKILSIDCVLISQKPKLSPVIPQMKSSLCEVLRLDPSRLHIKSTTTDHLGFVGREEGLACQAVCLMELA